jgi:hypothetical protein
MLLTWLTLMPRRLQVLREVWIPKWWSMWVPIQELGSMTLLVTAWSKRRTTMCILHPRLARGPLSQVCSSLELLWLTVLHIVYLRQVQGSGRRRERIRTFSNLRGFRNRLRWWYHRPRQDKAVHLELLLRWEDHATIATSLGILLGIAHFPKTEGPVSSACAPYHQAGMFSINNHPVVILFDSRSSHSFISQAFARKHEQKIVELECAYRISSTRADLLTNQIVRGQPWI